MKKVMIFGTFDLLHAGHRFFIEQAKSLGDYLVVVVARDKTVEHLKGDLPQENELQRKKNIEQLQKADLVILGDLQDHLNVIRLHKPGIILLGYDQRHFTDTLAHDLLAMGLMKTKIIRARAYKPGKFKTSLLKNGSA